MKKEERREKGFFTLFLKEHWNSRTPSEMNLNFFLNFEVHTLFKFLLDLILSLLSKKNLNFSLCYIIYFQLIKTYDT